MSSSSPVPGTGSGMLRRTIWRQRRRLLLGFPLLIAWQLGEAMTPVVIGMVVDHGVATGDTRAFLLWLLVLAALMAGFSLSYRFGGRLGLRSIQEESHALRSEIAGHVLDPRGADTDELPGEVLSLATADADMTGMVVRQLGFALGSIVAVLAIGGYLLVTDWVVGVLVLVGTPLVVAVTQLLAPMVARRTEAQQETVARASGVASDLMAGLRPLKGIGAEDAATQRYRVASRAAQRASITMAGAWGVLAGVSSGLSVLFLGVVAAVAGVRALDDAITLGQFIAIVGVAQYLAEPILALGELSAQAAASLASGRRISRFLQTPALVEGGALTPAAPPRTLRFDKVTAGPLKDLDLEVRQGELVALVADTPLADDAVIRLLHGTLRPDRGRVLLGPHPLDDLTLASRRDALLVNDHHADLFEGSIHDAIDPRRDLSEEQLSALLAASAGTDVIAAHPEGLDHRIRASGGTLSGGQRQRLTLARALAENRPVLVLHEPTSAVDAVTEQRIAAGLREARRPHATLVLTASPALLDVADVVVVVRNGTVVGRARHRELLRRDPEYAGRVAR
ncbi:ABC transporter ATP-binding protein [Aeromicrobium phragmitis]|uniref:ABC transporter ATP-binding protein n=1 Tax=Aeromicrobium phragmitis TaxID=2478914 RepID=A0A3L8PQR0_9ACTN|nr:ABC transporter ATP-binding protein [Aeromicrobium phragmitis]RLV56798.1 ABC transporter ATP-binding protein [Aeromicrobium phragmitis]